MRLMAPICLRRTLLSLGGILLAMGSICLPPVGARDDDVSRAALRGVPVIRLLAKVDQPGLDEPWLAPNHFGTEVERQLRQAGIPTAPDAPDRLLVEVAIDRAKASSSLYVYTVAVQFFRAGIPEVRKLARIPHWSVGEVDVVGGANLAKVRARVVEYIRRFIQTYREQNPKP